jgi:hypothetical protein
MAAIRTASGDPIIGTLRNPLGETLVGQPRHDDGAP